MWHIGGGKLLITIHNCCFAMSLHTVTHRVNCRAEGRILFVPATLCDLSVGGRCHVSFNGSAAKCTLKVYIFGSAALL